MDTLGEFIVSKAKEFAPKHMDSSNLSLDSTFEETGFDGCDAEDFIEAINEEYNLAVTIDKFCDWKTLTDVHGYITEEQNA